MRIKAFLRRYWMVACISIAFAVGLNSILLVSDVARYSKAYQEAAASLYAPPLWKQILYSGILIPIMEEMIFRGCIYRFLRRRVPFWWSALISAMLFGIYHGNLVQFIYAGICGFMLAYLYEKYRYIAVPIVAHMLMNIVVCLMSDFGGFTWVMGDTVRVVIIISGCILLTAYMFARIQKVDETPEIDILQNC